MRTVTVVGASLAGLQSVTQLRAQGYDGRIVVLGAEAHRPYDRPPLSKGFLEGSASTADLALSDPADEAGLDAQWLLGIQAARLDAATGTITLSDGTEIATDGVVIATGGSPRTLPGSEELDGVYTLRTIEDAVNLRAELTGGASSVVVVGAGWIGAEVASTCRSLGLRVTVVEAADAPLAGALGKEMAAVCTALHDDHGVTLRCGVGVERFSRRRHGDRDRVTGVVLADGTTLPADVVVVGVGMRPTTGWLAGSGIDVDDGVVCDSGCVTRVPSVVAVGDVARYRSAAGHLVRHEHWTNASEQPATAIRNLLAGSTIEDYRPSGYVWSEQYGVRLQFTGHTGHAEEVEVIDGSPDDRKFVAVYRRGGNPVGVLAMNNAKLFARTRRQLTSALVS
ncbi:MAG: NAD(P)/FAD-dependent oxidoreductase [Actinophytocola sp.]|nr:NAD(P)/FAD-dependent oxidoreductase [Actinophytocola sp.]